MDTNALPIELTLAHERFERIEARTAKNFGVADTEGALAVAQEVLPRLGDALSVAARDFSSKGGDTITNGDISRLVNALDPDVVSLCVLQGMLTAIADDTFTVVNAAIRIGKSVNGELWADGLRRFADANAEKETDKLRKKAAAMLPERIEAAVRRKHGSLKQRLVSARAIARRAGFEWKDHWTTRQTYRVGLWLLNVALEALPDVFTTIENENGAPCIVITDGGLETARKACQQMVCSNPFYVPDAEPPQPWTDFAKGGPNDPRVRAVLVRGLYGARKETIKLIREAIANGQMQPALDAVNAVQATAWKINARVLGVMKACIEKGYAVEGLASGVDIPVIEHGDWETMTDPERDLWKLKTAEVKQANRALVGDRLSLVEDMTVAEQLADLPAFWTAYNMDWRGRVYALPNFNFQRSDRVRALFLFAEGCAIGEEGLQWLKVHLANCGAFEKVDKKSYDDRLAWVDANMEKIEHCASYPLTAEARAFWTRADNPFLFLAACMELVAACTTGPTYVSALPVSWDGSCSGLQHLCAMTRAEEGWRVNLTDSDKPQDVYQHVAEEAVIQIQEDADKGDRVAKLAMAFGMDRKVFKRNTMTFSYASKTAGMSNQQDEDLMEKLRIEVLKGERSEHPFGDDARKRNKNVPSYAARYLGKVAYTAITNIVKKPAEAMKHLQDLARLMAHEGKPLTWVTPLGLPWANRYHARDMQRVQLFLHDRGVKRPYNALLTVGDLKAIDKEKAANGVAANFTHACDGAHLGKTVNAGAREGMTYFALVHDSFGCHAAWAARFQGIIREQFVEMYETHDVLAEVFEQAKCALSEHNLRRLPAAVERGPLNIKEVLNAKYAFA